jgi:hypothetical protein
MSSLRIVMPVDVTLWAEHFRQNEFPSFRCPTCQKGTLTLVPDSLRIVESERSKRAMRDAEDWEPDWTEKRFSALLTCSSSTCGELVVVSGDTEVVEEDDADFRRVWASHPRPRSFFQRLISLYFLLRFRPMSRGNCGRHFSCFGRT